ncbi:MAG TPA: hypothetical protein VHC69_24875 [Polyangiaceae bacterium]|nr:hypothetical protein [Polyangiaceae bacterium]
MRREYRPDISVTRRTVAGARLAAISVAAGAVATVGSLLAVAYLAAVGASSAHAEQRAQLASHSESPRAAYEGARRLDGLTDHSARPVREHRIGDITLVDVGAEIPSLDEELDRQRGLSMRAHERLLVWLVVPDCKSCNAVEAALSSPEVQHALGKARLVRLDAVEFLAELSRIGVPMDAFPAFVLLGRDGHAADYLHDGEWDDDIPENIAPVLKSFVEGTYTRRRSPWHGGLHEDETPI